MEPLDKSIMKLLLAAPRGFCAGVVRAIETVERALEKWGPPIYVKHQIVHNQHVVRKLEKLGAIFIENLSEVPRGGRIIYSAHGVSPAVRAEAKERGLFEVDATCGLVTRVHSAAIRFAKKGYHVILIGHRSHVETVGTAGEVPGQVTIVENIEEVEALTFSQREKLCYLTQTTLSVDDVTGIVLALVRRFPSIETLPTSSICYATTNRQEALKVIAKEADLILVVGDQTSSNSNRLREVGERFGIPAYLVNSPEEIEQSWLEKVQVIGLTAGASTPEEIVQACIAHLETLGVDTTEEAVLTREDVAFALPI